MSLVGNVILGLWHTRNLFCFFVFFKEMLLVESSVQKMSNFIINDVGFLVKDKSLWK